MTTPRLRFMLVATGLVLCLALAPVAFAGKGGGTKSGSRTSGTSRTSGGGGKKGGGGGGGGTTGGSGSLTLKMVKDLNGNGLPNWGDTVTFNVSTNATTEPNVSLTCSQNGTVVYGAVSGFYSSYPWPWTQNMTLSSNAWQGGAASCTAKLYYFVGTQTIDLTSINFTAYE